MSTLTSVGDNAAPTHHASRVGTSPDAELSEAQTARPCPGRTPAQACSSASCVSAGQVPASPEMLRLPRAAYCASARSRHLQQYLESTCVTTPTGQRPPAGGRDRSAHPDTEAAKGAATHAERMQAFGRQPGGPQLRSAFADLLPDDPVTFAGREDRLGASCAVTASSATQRRPSTVPNMRSRLTACSSGHDVGRPGTSAGLACAANAEACIGPWSSDTALGGVDVDDGKQVIKGDGDRPHDNTAAGRQDESLGPQYAGWTWGPGSASCLQNTRKDSHRYLEKNAVGYGPFDKSTSGGDLLVEEQSKTDCGDEAAAEDCYMLTCSSVDINAVLMSQLMKAGDDQL